jgi:LacI family transcriptional regulator
MAASPPSRRPARRKSLPSVPFVSIFVEASSSWGRRVVAGIIEYAKAHGPWHIELHTGGPEEIFALDRTWRPDGIIGRVPNPAVARALRARKVPVVNCSGIIVPGADFPAVTGSYLGDARIAAEHFWARGFSHFAYVGHPDASYANILYEKFCQVLATRGHRCAFHRSVDRPEDYVPWLRQLPKPVGVLCWGPAIGHRVLDACLKFRLTVPDDIAVMGCDFDDLQSDASYPEQTGIRTAAEQIGRTAAGVLDTLFHGRKPARMRQEIEPLGVIARLSTDTLAIRDARLAAVMRYIHDHAHEPITVEDILRREPMARRSLERKFRQTFGRSIVEQIRQIRINKLRLLLATTDEPITRLAEACGFASYKYMGLVFQEATGMSPRDFRRQNRPVRGATPAVGAKVDI